jgi:hypothetical protein
LEPTLADNEDHGERLDRELMELLNELRVVIPGVQVLFAFLLTVPFSQRFTEISQANRTAFFVAVVCTAVSAALLLAVPNYHRVMFRAFQKERLVRTANRLAMTGSAMLGIAIVVVLYGLTDVLYGGPLVVLIPLGVGVLMGWFWFLLPVIRRVRHGADSSPPAGSAPAGATGASERLPPPQTGATP